MLLGPSLLGEILPEGWDWLIVLYWPLVTLLTVGGLTSLYHVSTPRRSPWLRDAPGACSPWSSGSLASFVVRGHHRRVAGGGTSIYGPLSAPIVLLIWLYALAIAVLIGAAVQRRHPRALAARGAAQPARAVRRLGRRSCAARRTERRRAAGRLGRPVRRLRLRGDADDDLGLAGLREAARGPLTPMSGAGRSTPHRRRCRASPVPAAPQVEPGHRVDVER